MNRSQSPWFFLLVFCLLAFALPAQATQTRTALVIGNSAYRHTEPLKNPQYDAISVAETLQQLGFRVFQAIDATKPEMDNVIKQFAVALETSDAGLFFYAGHGLQIDGRNFLLPVDAELTSPAALEFEMVRLDQIQAIMERLTPTNILIMDACRNNPLSRNLARAMGTRSVSIGSGLAPSESGAGTLIAYSTQPGSVALDGQGQHSPFAQALLKFLDARGEDLSSILINVRKDVMKSTYGKQIPWEHSALSQRFYFVPPDTGPDSRSTTANTPSERADPRLELELWAAVKDSGNAQMLKVYLERYPQGTFSGIAALRIAELETKTAALGQPEQPAIAPRAPAIRFEDRIQRELKRAGCYDGPVDGVWGAGSEAALEKFAESHGKPLQSLEPNEANLEAVLATEGRVCALACKAGTIERDGACVAKAPEGKSAPAVENRNAQRHRNAERATRSTRKAPKQQPKKKFQFCIDGRNLIVDCDDASAVLRW